ncbi:hypothetical protein RJT34_08805 [Clitoria ternatea]|uniref:Uncharacterized protein n=1 Tax=Clitoria ternatea TaxID=43366 RepID=A0AAN9K4Z6_CLITE
MIGFALLLFLGLFHDEALTAILLFVLSLVCFGSFLFLFPSSWNGIFVHLCKIDTELYMYSYVKFCGLRRWKFGNLTRLEELDLQLFRFLSCFNM